MPEITQEDAEQFVVGLETSNPELASQVQVVPVSLADVYQLDLPEDDLEFAFVPEDEAVADASSSAVANGAEYEGGVPLFAARGGENNGYLTVEEMVNRLFLSFSTSEKRRNLLVDLRKHNQS